MRVVLATQQDGYAPRLAAELRGRGLLTRYLSGPRVSLRGLGLRRVGQAMSSLVTFGAPAPSAFDRAVEDALRSSGADLFLTTTEVSPRVLDTAHAAGLATVLLVQAVHVQERMRVRAEEHRRLGLDWNPEAFDRRAAGELAVYEQADLLVVPNQGIRASFLARGTPPERLVTVPRARLGELRPAPRPRGIFRLLAEGTADLSRGTHLLLQAFRQLDLPEAELVLLGVQERELDPFLLRWGTAGVRSEPGRDPLRRQALFQEASVYCAPHLTPGTGEGVLEAQAFGLPVLTSEAGAGCDWVTDGREGRILPKGRVEPLVEALTTLHRDPRLAHGMGLASLERSVSSETWGTHLLRLQAALRPLLSRRRRPRSS